MTIQRNAINRQAQGFLNFFRAKVGGQGPNSISTDVLPIIDVAPFTAVGLLRTTTVSATGNPPANLNVTVPALELWWITHINLALRSQTTLPADESASWAIQIQGMPDDVLGATGDCNCGYVTISTVGAGAITSPADAVVYRPNGLLVEGGNNIQGQLVIDNTTGNYVARLDILYRTLER